MQYAVPQFTDVEDKLIGRLTLKQFLVVMIAGGIDLMFWSLLKFSIFFFLFAIPISIAGLALALGSFNGRPLLAYIGVFLSYNSKPQVRVFRREEPNVVIKMEKKPVAKAENKVAEPTESRLRNLAYLLDQKNAEERDLIQGSKNG